MGSWISKDLIIEDYKPNRIGYSLDKRTSDWDTIAPKNAEYYFGKKRFTYISREHYKNDFIKGYLWGRYEIKKQPTDEQPTDEAEQPTGEDDDEYTI